MDLPREVGLAVRALRKRRGLTQATLAERIGQSEAALRAIERGASAPGFVTLARLARALEVPAAAFFPHGPPPGPGRNKRRACAVASLTALARNFDDDDLALAQAMITAIAEAAFARRYRIGGL